ncbi:MAG TPA: hypothetical protein VEK11_03810 [Thermoanaerobaculia bacterium]|nr:hypothetical protein [Thermoanaerobaculia bacterium]
MQRLILVPLAGAVLALASMALGADAAPQFLRALLVASLLLMAGSGFLTAARFSAGDRLLLSWLLLGAGYLFSAVRHGTRLIAYFEPSIALPPAVNTILVIAQNVAIALALLLFVLAWRATGLTAPVSRQAQLLSIAAGITLAVLAGGYPLLQGLGTTDTNPILLVSTAGDIVGLALIVPLALSAFAMRGGLLMHTWVYLAASEVAWLLYDVWWAFEPRIQLAENVNTAIFEALRIVAILCAFTASAAQRRAMR